MRPSASEYAPFYGTYVRKVEEENPLSALENSFQEAKDFLSTLPAEKAEYRYAEGKWSVKEVLQHIVDTERIMAYRALAIARNDKTPLPGFDENNYVENLDIDHRSLADIIAEFLELRISTLSLFGSFTREVLLRQGTMSGNPASVRALGFIITGHQLHHFQVLKERYL
jgi:uncharacterized damage-inducible protein DinB